jgi:hydroxymethylpyrimidine pyrophosphatase-like HAD family hydrolase
LLRWLKNTKRIEPYFISGAHPALVVPAAYKLGISSCHVFCNGHQLTEKEAEIFDKKRREKPDENHQTILNEVRERFPYEKYANSQTLRQFLDRYLEICIKINDLYIQNQISESRLQSMKKEQLGLLREVRKIDSDLAKDLKYLLYTEDGVMGAHRKKQALALIEKREKAKKECLIYIGDGMVDADPLAYAGNGISVNCTNKDALLSSRLNVATPNLEALIPVIDLIVTDKHTLPESKDYLEKEINKRISSITNTAPESVLFTADEIKADINAVTQANKLCKDYIKKLQ